MKILDIILLCQKIKAGARIKVVRVHDLHKRNWQIGMIGTVGHEAPDRQGAWLVDADVPFYYHGFQTTTFWIYEDEVEIIL